MRRILVWLIAGAGLYLTADRVRRGGEAELEAVYVDVSTATVRVARDSSGGRPTLAFLHGYSESLFAWRQVIDQLRTEYSVVALDLPGFGLSSKPDSGYAVDSMVARVARALQQVTHQPFVLIGNSMGGQVAATFAIEHPELVEALVLVDAAGLPGRVLSRLDRLSPEAVSRVLGVGSALSSAHDPRWLAEPESLLTYQPSADEAYYRALESVLREFDFNSLDGRLQDITHPTLIIWGRFDGTTPIENGRRFANEIADARLVIIEGALHRPHYTHPDQVASLIREFVRDVAGDQE